MLNSTLRESIRGACPPRPPQTTVAMTAAVTAVAAGNRDNRDGNRRFNSNNSSSPEKEVPANVNAEDETKYRKVQRGRMKGAASRGNYVSYGDYGIQALEPGWITANQIEAARIAMTRYTKRGGKVWIKIFPDKPVTKKALGTRMGSGKGAPEYWVAVVKAGKVMFEIGGVPEDVAREALRLAMHKLPDQAARSSKREDTDSGNGGEA